jgi:hypothetical protein
VSPTLLLNQGSCAAWDAVELDELVTLRLGALAPRVLAGNTVSANDTTAHTPATTRARGVHPGGLGLLNSQFLPVPAVDFVDPHTTGRTHLPTKVRAFAYLARPVRHPRFLAGGAKALIARNVSHRRQPQSFGRGDAPRPYQAPHRASAVLKCQSKPSLVPPSPFFSNSRIPLSVAMPPVGAGGLAAVSLRKGRLAARRGRSTSRCGLNSPRSVRLLGKVPSAALMDRGRLARAILNGEGGVRRGALPRMVDAWRLPQAADNPAG